MVQQKNGTKWGGGVRDCSCSIRTVGPRLSCLSLHHMEGLSLGGSALYSPHTSLLLGNIIVKTCVGQIYQLTSHRLCVPAAQLLPWPDQPDPGPLLLPSLWPALQGLP